MLFAVMTSSSTVPVMWAWITKEMRGGTNVAVSVGFINSFAVAAGLIGPNLSSGIQTVTGSYAWVAGAAAGFSFLSLCFVIMLKFCLKNSYYEDLRDDEEVKLS